jgi:hypothetical protein
MRIPALSLCQFPRVRLNLPLYAVVIADSPQIAEMPTAGAAAIVRELLSALFSLTYDLAKNDFLRLEPCIGCADQK